MSDDTGTARNNARLAEKAAERDRIELTKAADDISDEAWEVLSDEEKLEKLEEFAPAPDPNRVQKRRAGKPRSIEHIVNAAGQTAVRDYKRKQRTRKKNKAASRSRKLNRVA